MENKIGNDMLRLAMHALTFGGFVWFMLPLSSAANETSNQYFSDPFVASEFQAHVFGAADIDTGLMTFYAERSFIPFWYGNINNLSQFQKAVVKADDHGLPTSKYEFEIEREQASVYEFEISVMKSFISLISDLHSFILYGNYTKLRCMCELRGD